MANPTAPAPSTSGKTPSGGPRRGLGRRALRRLARLIYGGKRALLTVPLTLGLFYFGWVMADYWWNYGYSRGTRVGVINKVSWKGRPLCKYVSADLVVMGVAGQLNPNAQTFTFTIDDEREDAPLLLQLQAAQKSLKPVTVHYREDLHNLPWRWCVEAEACPPNDDKCVPGIYHATSLE